MKYPQAYISLLDRAYGRVLHTPHQGTPADLILLKRELHTTEALAEDDGLIKWLMFRLEVLKEIKSKGTLRCEYCGKENLLIEDASIKDVATLDHVMPTAKGGGKYDRKNLVVACFSCNQKKRDRTDWVPPLKR
jgi:5-methylcytosine-specific restriction endonuclease McrA